MSPAFPFRSATDTSLFSRKETEKQKWSSYLTELSKFGLERREDCKNIMKIFVSQLKKNPPPNTKMKAWIHKLQKLQINVLLLGYEDGRKKYVLHKYSPCPFTYVSVAWVSLQQTLTLQ